MTLNPAVIERAPVDSSVEQAREDLGHRSTAGFTVSIELLAWLAVIAVAALVRLTNLDALPLGPAESLRARAALDVAGGGSRAGWDGDLGAALTALAVRLIGDTAFAVRIVSAGAGIVAVLCLALYRPLIGRSATLLGAALMAISPAAIVSARTFAAEAVALPLALLLPPLAASIWLRGRRGLLPVLMLIVGFGLGTGALVPTAIVVVVAWFGIEFGWRDGRAAWGLAPFPRRSRWFALSVVALLPGLALAIGRYGGDINRLTLPAVRAFADPPGTISSAVPWHWVADVLLGYEPLLLALGLAGVLFVARGWDRRSPGERLLLVWVAITAPLTIFWHHADPAQLLALTAPLALLGGMVTAAALRRVTPALIGQAGLVLLPFGVACGFTLIMLVRWANRQQIDGGDAIAALLMLVGGASATGFAVWLRRIPAAVLVSAAWVVLGGLTLHAGANAAFSGGSEFVAPQRTRPEVAAVVREFDAIADPGAPVWVERKLWPVLAWPLRDRPVRRFVETAPAQPAALPVAVTDAGPQAGAHGASPLVERWVPRTWDTLGVLRWWVFRTPWGPVDTTWGTVTAE